MPMYGCLYTYIHICIYTIYIYFSHKNFVSAEQKVNTLSSFLYSEFVIMSQVTLTICAPPVTGVCSGALSTRMTTLVAPVSVG